MLHPIEVMALDENFNRASGGIAYRSLIWKRRYYECGTFELYVPKTIYKPTWKYIYTADRPETGIIETVCATDDVHAWGGIDTVKVSGRFAESLLSRKVLIPSRVTGYGSTGDNVAVSMQWAQEIFGDRFEYLAPDFEGVERPMAPKPSPYGLILYDELKMAEASYRVLYDFTGDTWTLQPWRGLDRTQSQLPIAPDPDEPDVPDEPTIDDLYEPLDYIVATGEQWIDTGVYPKYDTRVELDISHLTNTGSMLFGSKIANIKTATDQFALFRNSATAIRSDYFGTNVSMAVSDTMPRTTVVRDGRTATAWGVTANNTAVSSGVGEYTMFLIALNTAGSMSAGVPAACRAYGSRIYDGGESGTLIRDYVPKRRISDGAVGMLDLVSEVFYTSASGVAFLAPGELPAGYTRLEYIESTGSQYIDTGVNAQSGIEAFVDWEFTETGASVSILSATNGTRVYPIYYTSNQWVIGCASSILNSGTAASVGIRYEVYSKFYDGEQTLIVDGETVLSTANSATMNLGINLHLFSLNNNGSAINKSKAKCYSMWIRLNGALAMDCVPAKNSGGEAGLFDLVSMTFFADASGTGFVAGPEVAAVAEASTFSLTRTVATSEETTEVPAVNAFALFSDQMGTIRDYVAVKDASGYKNTCIIDYEYEEPAAWNDDGTPYATPIYEWIAESGGTAAVLVGYQIHYNIKRGTITARIADDLPDDEAYLDLTGTKPPYDGEWSRSQYEPDALPDFPTDMYASYAAFPAALEAEGFKHLQANHPYVEEIDTGELSTGGYLRRWDLGDKVDALLLDIGIDMEARITGVDEVYEGATRSVTPIIGEKKHRRL